MRPYGIAQGTISNLPRQTMMENNAENKCVYVHIYMTTSLCCTAETCTTLKIYCTFIKKPCIQKLYRQPVIRFSLLVAEYTRSPNQGDSQPERLSTHESSCLYTGSIVPAAGNQSLRWHQNRQGMPWWGPARRLQLDRHGTINHTAYQEKAGWLGSRSHK